MKRATIITLILSVILTLSACGKPVTLSAPELKSKERLIDYIYNSRTDHAFILGIEENPWVVPKTPKEVIFLRKSLSGNELLIYPIPNGDDNLIYKTLEKEVRIENAEYFGSCLSDDGTTFTYAKKDSQTGENVLHLVKNDETKEIFRDFNLCTVNLSPSGSTVLISLYENAAD
jgi:hypothetical protein